MGETPMHIEYDRCSMYEAVAKTAAQYPDLTALTFLGKKIPYAAMKKNIDRCASALSAIGVREND